MGEHIKIEKRPAPSLGENRFIKMEVYYALGGCNYFNGGTDPRGYYISATPIAVDGIFESTVLMSGFRHFVITAKKFSRKKLEELAAELRVPGTPLHQRMEEMVARTIAVEAQKKAEGKVTV